MICSSVNRDRFIVHPLQGDGLYSFLDEVQVLRSNVPCLDLGADCKQASRENRHESVAPFVDPRNMGPSGRLQRLRK
jgi:hypothetical protein